MSILIENGVDIDTQYTDSIVISSDGGNTYTPIRKNNIGSIGHVFNPTTGPANTKFSVSSRISIKSPDGKDIFNMELQELDSNSAYHSDQAAVEPWNSGTPAAVANAVNKVNSWL